jgi:hypothetical protein
MNRRELWAGGVALILVLVVGAPALLLISAQTPKARILAALCNQG